MARGTGGGAASLTVGLLCVCTASADAVAGAAGTTVGGNVLGGGGGAESVLVSDEAEAAGVWLVVPPLAKATTSPLNGRVGLPSRRKASWACLAWSRSATSPSVSVVRPL
jgi:hypothetical protein